MKLLKLINERAPLETATFANIIVQNMEAVLPVTEMRAKRGSEYDNTLFYQIRVKPSTADLPLPDLLHKIEKWLKHTESKAMGITEIQINEHSRNSGKYSSVSFNIDSKDYDIVVAAGGNKGEKFEKEMLLKMDSLIAKGAGHTDNQDEEQAQAAFDALAQCDPDLRFDNIASVSPRTGSTQRSGNLSPEETGAIIADIVIHLKNGDKKYISLKNSDGTLVANFGISKAFRDDLTVNTDSAEWKNWLQPFNLSTEKIYRGLVAAKEKTEIDFPDIEHVDIKIKKDHPIYKIMQKMWGLNYYYLREQRGGFKALNINADYVDNTLLKNLHITQIRYPWKDRKQITIYIESDSNKFKIDVRNPSGNSIRPTRINMSVVKTK